MSRMILIPGIVTVIAALLVVSCEGTLSPATGDIDTASVPEAELTIDNDFGYVLASDGPHHVAEVPDEEKGYTTKGNEPGSSSYSDSSSYPDGSSSGDEAVSSDSTVSDSDTAAASEPDDAAREIVEADIYKVAGSLIWVLNRYRGLMAVSVEYPDKPTIVSRISFSGAPKEMFVRDGRAYILVNDLLFDAASPYYSTYSYNRILSAVLAVDISDSAHPEIIGRYTVEGSIIDSRMVGDVIYVAATQRTYSYYDCDDTQQAGFGGISVMSVNIADPTRIEKVDEERLEGFAYSMYVTDHSIYIADSDYYAYQYDDEESGRFPVHYFDISDPAGDIVKKDTFKTGVYISDRWKMFEKDGVFFAVGNKNNSWSGTCVVESYTVGDPNNIKKISELTFMENQQLYGTRYDGNTLYAVTYQRTDPLHVIDIADPAEMRQLGELWIPGWSTFFEIRDGRLLAVGIDDQNGRAAKLSLYDVRDPADPREVDTVLLTPPDAYGTSEANYDWKAFGIFDDMKLLLIPTSFYEKDPAGYYYGRYRYNLNIVDFDLDEGFDIRGSVESPGPVKRGIIANNMIVSIGDTHLMVIDPADHDQPKIRAELPLAFNLQSLFLLSGQVAGAVSFNSDYYYGNANSFALFDADTAMPKEYISSLTSDYYYGRQYFYEPHAAYFVERYYSEGYKTKVRKVSLSGADGLSEESFTLKLDPYEGEKATLVLGAKDQMVGYRTRGEYYCDGEPRSEQNDCSGQSYYYVSRVRLLVFPLSDTEQDISPRESGEEVRPLGSVRFFKDGKDTIWTTDCTVFGYDDDDREILKCYAQSFITDAAGNPSAAARYNIPGELVGLNDDATIFYSVRDHELVSEQNGAITLVPHLYILHRSGASLKVAGVIALTYAATHSDTLSETLQTLYLIQNNDVAISTFYRRQERTGDCAYWQYTDPIKHFALLTLFDAGTAQPRFSATVEGGYQFSGVQGGGIIFSVAEKTAYRYWGRNFAEGYAYFDPNGATAQIKIGEITNYARSYDSYYYYQPAGDTAALQGDHLYIASGWMGLLKEKIK